METHHWRVYPPPSLHYGVFFFFFLLLNGHRSQNTATLHRSPCYPTGIFTIWQPASGRLSVFSASASKMSHRKETRRKEKPSRKDSITKCQVLTKTEKYKHIFRHMNTHAYTRTFFFLTLRRICVHTSVRSHHITHGEEILLFVCALFCAFPFPGLSSSVTSPMHTDILQVHTLIHFVTLIPDSQGTPISSLSPSLKS